MTYVAYKTAILDELKKHRGGKTWKELRNDLALPYDRPCPEWTKRLESEVGLARVKGGGRELVWRIAKKN